MTEPRKTTFEETTRMMFLCSNGMLFFGQGDAGPWGRDFFYGKVEWTSKPEMIIMTHTVRIPHGSTVEEALARIFLALGQQRSVRESPEFREVVRMGKQAGKEEE